eukprot:1633675-Prymnesium_polylepis.1
MHEALLTPAPRVWAPGVVAGVWVRRQPGLLLGQHGARAGPDARAARPRGGRRRPLRRRHGQLARAALLAAGAARRMGW